jgi:hypothetical protein
MMLLPYGSEHCNGVEVQVTCELVSLAQLYLIHKSLV